jgi:hypothetical protein
MPKYAKSAVYFQKLENSNNHSEVPEGPENKIKEIPIEKPISLENVNIDIPDYQTKRKDDSEKKLDIVEDPSLDNVNFF